MEKKFVSVVTYLHNNSDEISKFLESVVDTISNNFEQYEMILVDDACEDDTVIKVEEFAKSRELKGMISLVHMGIYQGIEASMNAGRDLAIGDFVYEFDSCFIDYDIDMIVNVYNELLTGYDIVSASSDAKAKLTSKMFYRIYNRSNRGFNKIGSETFRIISRRAINRIKSVSRNIPYRKAVYANCGLKMITLSYKTTDRNSKTKRKEMFSKRGTLALDSFIYFTNVLEKISLIISILFLLVTVLMGTYAIVDYFVENGISEGWASTICFMSMGFFGVFFLLTIIIKYLSVMLNLIFKQSKYLVADIEKVSGNRNDD